MKLSVQRISAVLKKEFIQLKRDKATFAMIFMIPVMQLLLFGYAIDNDPKHLPTAVLSRDNTVFSRSLISGLKNSEYFDIKHEIKSDKEGKMLLQKGKTQFVVTIPENFSRDMLRGDKPDILIETDSSDPVASNGALGALNGILKSVLSRDIKGPISYLASDEYAANILVHKLYNPEGFTRFNIVPGLIAVVLTLTGVIMTALALTKERERGTMENLLAMPVTSLEVMIGKIAPYVIIGYIQAVIILLAARFLFHVPMLGSIGLLAAALLVFIICNLSLGFLVSTVARSQPQALQLSFLVFLPSIMLSGFMFPFLGMPGWAQAIGNCLPMTYFLRIVRSIFLKGGTFHEIWPNFWPLLVFMMLTSMITVKLYRRTLD